MISKKQTIHTLIQAIAQAIQPCYQDRDLCNQYAWWMVHAITQKSSTQLLTAKSIRLTESQLATLNEWINLQVTKQMPLQYLIGSIPFVDLEIRVAPPILIPRPETEQWCQELIERLRTLSNTALTILDLCTGSGCIALVLAKALPHAQVYATDISDYALALAQKNARHNNINNVTFFKSDLFTNIPNAMRFDLIVSNPPYITQTEWHTLALSVKQWEDKQALVAPRDGIGILEKIITHSRRFLQKNIVMQQQNIPQLIVEIGYMQGEKTSRLMQQAGYTTVQIQKDFSGNDRIVLGSLNNVATATKEY